MFRYASPAGLALAAALVVVLAVQNRTLRQEHTVLLDRVNFPYAGMWVPATAVTTLDGAPVAVGEPGPGRTQVLLHFTTTCRYCRASLPAWKQVAARLGETEGAGVQLIGVSQDSLDVTRRYAREHALPFPVVRMGDARSVGLFRARAVPLVTVVHESGRVAYARVGALTTEAAVDSVVAVVRAAARVGD